MDAFDRLKKVVAKLRAEDGCPWDRTQTHASLKPTCIEEAAEVVCGINILEDTGDPANLKEELGDLLLQVVMQAQIAEEEGLFTIEDVAEGISDKMIRRHPHVFGKPLIREDGSEVTDWNEIKQLEKAGREWEADYLPEAFRESRELLNRAMRRKNIPHNKN